VKVVVGNPFALEGFRDENSDEPERVRYRTIEGERETSFFFPEGMPLTEMASAVIESIPLHMDLSLGNPPWIEADDTLLKKILCQHYGISDRKKRPARWGDGTNGPYTTGD